MISRAVWEDKFVEDKVKYYNKPRMFLYIKDISVGMPFLAGRKGFRSLFRSLISTIPGSAPNA